MINYSNIRAGKHCVVWSRVSTKYQQDNGGSIATQKKICEEYASLNNYSIKYYCGGEHESAMTPGPLIQGMMKKVKTDSSISTILISEFDRFSRELWQATKMLQELRKLGVIVVACKYGLDTRTKEGMLMAQNTLAMAQWDNQNRTDKFVTGRADCMKAGAWIEKAPRGYYKEGKSRDTFCYLNETGKLIAKAFAWKLQNISNKDILSRLEARGLSLSKQEIHKILVNPFYAGKIRHKFTDNELIDGRIEPAVSYADFLKVQDILSGKTGKYCQQKEKDNFPLSKHVFCLADNTPLTSYTRKKKTKKHELIYDYYKCRETGCHTNVAANEMHEKYEALLENYNLSEDMVTAFEDILREHLRSYAEESRQQTRSLKKSISEVESSIKKIKMRFAEGLIDEDTYQTAVQEYVNRKDVLTLELEKWSENISNLEMKIPTIVKIASGISSMWGSATLDNKRKIQNLVFPHGVFWDKENRTFRTTEKNSVFAILDTLVAKYNKKTEAEKTVSVPLCG